jgi:hypothetical protein
MGRIILASALCAFFMAGAAIVGLALWSFVSDRANAQISLYRSCVDSDKSEGVCTALICGYAQY